MAIRTFSNKITEILKRLLKRYKTEIYVSHSSSVHCSGYFVYFYVLLCAYILYVCEVECVYFIKMLVAIKKFRR